MPARRSGLALALVMAAAGVVAPGARAEPVLELGVGSGAAGAVTDAAGTLHALWRNVVPIANPVVYCRTPAGGTGCTPVEITKNASAAPRLLLRPQDGALIALVPRDIESLALWVTASADGGATWSTPMPVASGLREVDDAALTPDGSAIDVVGTGPEGFRFQRLPLTGGETRVVRLGPDGIQPGRVSHLADGRPVVAGEFAVNQVSTRVAAPGADVNTPAAWSQGSWRRIARVGPRVLDSGPTGTWLLTRAEPPEGQGLAVRLWRFGSAGFGLARRVGALGRPPAQPIGTADSDSRIAFDVDLAGRLHAVWTRQPRRCGGQHCLVYRRTDRSGFGPPVSYPVGATTRDAPIGITAAANSGGSGWIVWTAGTNVRAVPLVTPPLGSRVGSRRLGRLRLSIPDFYACAASGGEFVHRLRVDGRRGRIRIVSVRFTFDGGEPSAVDARAPYRVPFRLPFAAGTRHVAGATITYRLGGERRTTSIGRTFVMC